VGRSTTFTIPNKFKVKVKIKVGVGDKVVFNLNIEFTNYM
jgi:hypothetical protein